MIDRKIAPSLHPIQEIKYIDPEKYTLKNGVPLYAIRDTTYQTIQVEFVFNAGTINLKGAIANLTGGLLLAGTDQLSSNDIEEKIDALGGFKQIKVRKESSSVIIVGLKEHCEQLVSIVINALLNASFDDKEIKQYVQTSKQRLKINLEKVEIQANQLFSRQLFPHSAYGDNVTVDDFDTVTKKDIIEFYKNYYLNGLKYIQVVGAINDSTLDQLKIIGEKLGVSKMDKPILSFKNVPKTIHRSKEGALQSAIRVGRIAFNKTHSDYQSFIILDTILGGYFGSRLMSSLREDKGFTYGIYSGIRNYEHTGFFYISTEVNSEVREEAIEIIRQEIEKLQTNLVSDEELELVRNYFIGEILEQSDGPNAMMDCFISTHKYGLDTSFYSQLIHTARTITSEQIRSMAQKWLKWEDMIVVSFG